jgi:hypothetical protein
MEYQESDELFTPAMYDLVAQVRFSAWNLDGSIVYRFGELRLSISNTPEHGLLVNSAELVMEDAD